MDTKLTFKEIVLDLLSRMTSRKFLAPIIYIVILILNETLEWGLSDELLSVVAGLLGVFQVVEGVKDIKRVNNS